MKAPTDRQILIVGGGPTGLVLAHELARHGGKCRIIDKNWGISSKSRAIAVQARTLECLQIMGMPVQDLIARGHRVQYGRIFNRSGRETARIDFDSLPTRYSYMLLVPQDETERFLEAQLNRRGIKVERETELAGCSVEPDFVRAHLQTRRGQSEDASFDWIVGCDGAHSSVRHLMSFAFEGGSYRDAFLLADVSVDGELDRSAFQVFLAPEGPLAFFPLAGDRYRVVADNPPSDWRDDPSLEQCQLLVDNRAPGRLRLRNPRWISKFWLHHRHVKHLRKGRVFIAGDAAHIHSPAGGQGMNTGIQDAFNLGWKLAAVSRGEAEETLLDTYAAERLPVDDMVVRNSDRLTKLVTLKNPVGRFLRDHITPVLTSIPEVRRRAGTAVSELAIGYRVGPLSQDDAAANSKIPAGARAPDVEVRGPHGRTRLFDLLAEGKPILLLPPARPDSGDMGIQTERADLVCATLAGAEGEFGEDAGYFIRPDGHVGLRSRMKTLGDRLPRYLDKLYGPHRRH